MKKISILIILVLCFSIVLVGCNEVDDNGKGDVIDNKEDENEKNNSEENEEIGGDYMNLEQLQKPNEGEEIAVIKTNHGDIKVRFFENAAPKAVENFKTHAKDGYYDGVTFHRVMNDFMIQGGDPEGTGRGGESIWGSSFEDEFDPYYHNIRGALSMANAGPNTNGSQFFIVQLKDTSKDMISQMKQVGEAGGFSADVIDAYEKLGGTPWLDGKHTVFGQVFEGMDVVDEIAAVKVDGASKPVEPVIMETIEIKEYK